MTQQLSEVKKCLRLAEDRLEEERKVRETDRELLEKELNELRDITRDYGVQKDLYRELESELKRQLAEVNNQLATTKAMSVHDAEELAAQLDQLTSQNSALTSAAEKAKKEITE